MIIPLECYNGVLDLSHCNSFEDRVTEFQMSWRDPTREYRESSNGWRICVSQQYTTNYECLFFHFPLWHIFPQISVIDPLVE